MKTRLTTAFAAGFGLLVAPAVGAASLTLDDVLAASVQHFPTIQAAVTETLIRQGRNTSAMGAFDLALEQDGLVWADGFYDGYAVDNQLVKRLPQANTRVSAGYRLSNDDFPIYQQELVTNDAGEFSLGAVFSLWRDREIDARRFSVSRSELEIQAAQIELLLARLTTQRNAANAYWDWLLAGHRYRVLKKLLTLAEQRAGGLEKRANEGDVAAVFVVENEQNLLRRRALMTDARREFDVAAIALSLYLRDAEGSVQRPDGSALPDAFPPGSGPRLTTGPLIDKVLASRPELLQLDNLAVIEQKRLLLAENELKPRVDLGIKAAHDMGGGSRSRDGFDAIVDLEIAIPLERRRGRGRVTASRARLRQIALERKLVAEQLSNEVHKLVASIDAAAELSSITSAEFDRAERMVEAERKRFRAGASDFFLVNLREERSADAEIRNLEARARFLKSRTDLHAITLDFAALGL